MKSLTLASTILAGIQLVCGKPILTIEELNTLPAQSTLAKTVSIFESIVRDRTATTEFSEVFSPGFTDVRNLLDKPILAEDLIASSGNEPIYNAEGLSLLLPIFNRALCSIIQCNSSTQTPSDNSTLPQLLDPAAALARISGFADGTLPIPFIPDGTTQTIDVSVVERLIVSVTDLVKCWRQLKSWVTASDPWTLRARSISLHPGKRAVTVSAEDIREICQGIIKIYEIVEEIVG